MKRFKFTISTMYVGSDDYEIVEFDDDATEEEIQEVYVDWVMETNRGTFYETEEEE